jgi:DNA-binding IclR family transcriptional regulator
MADGPVTELLLRRLEAADGGLDSAELAAQLNVDHQAVVGAVKSLQALGEVSQTQGRLAFAPGAPFLGEPCLLANQEGPVSSGPAGG